MIQKKMIFLMNDTHIINHVAKSLHTMFSRRKITSSNFLLTFLNLRIMIFYLMCIYVVSHRSLRPDVIL